MRLRAADARKMVRPRATEGRRTYLPGRSAPGTESQGAEQQEGHGHSRRCRRLHGAAVRPPSPGCSAPHAQAAASGSRARRPAPGASLEPPAQPGPSCGDPGAAASAALPQCCVLRRLPLVGGASECCIGRLAVAKWFLAPPTSSLAEAPAGDERSAGASACCNRPALEQGRL